MKYEIWCNRCEKFAALREPQCVCATCGSSDITDNEPDWSRHVLPDWVDFEPDTFSDADPGL